MKPPDQESGDFSTKCVPKELLSDYGLGRLEWSEQESISLHLQHCPRCLELLGALDKESDPLLDELRGQNWELPVQPWDKDWESSLSALQMQPKPRVEPSEDSSLQYPQPPARIGSYQLVELIGEGGMGRVYKAIHLHLHKSVAIKLLSPGRLAREESLQRFQREMKAVGQVDHPNIVTAFDAGVAEVPFLAMELIDGIDLSRLVREKGPLSVPDACECIRQAALGLQHAHEKGYVHRDLKPSNLMLSNQAQIKMLDLGLARIDEERQSPSPGGALGADDSSSTKSTDDRILGTLAFIAPEQLLASSEVDIRADLYSLGCTLYFLLTGSPPFSKTHKGQRDIARAHLSSPVPDIRKTIPTIPDFLATILEQLMAKDPVYRPSLPKDLARALLPYVHGSDLTALVSSHTTKESLPPPRSTRRVPPKRSSAGWFLWACVLAVTLVGIGWIWRQMNTPEGPTTQPVTGPSSSTVVESFEVKHYRHLGGKLTLEGEIGDSPDPVRRDAHLLATLRMNVKGYAYVFVITPNENVHLCSPPSSSDKPITKRNVVAPERGTLRLSESGLYQFVALVSKQPLPSFESLAREGGTPLRTELPANAVQGVWRFDGSRVRTEQSDPTVGNNDLIRTHLRRLSAKLLELPHVDEVHILSFSVP